MSRMTDCDRVSMAKRPNDIQEQTIPGQSLVKCIKNHVFGGEFFVYFWIIKKTSKISMPSDEIFIRGVAEEFCKKDLKFFGLAPSNLWPIACWKKLKVPAEM